MCVVGKDARKGTHPDAVQVSTSFDEGGCMGAVADSIAQYHLTYSLMKELCQEFIFQNIPTYTNI